VLDLADFRAARATGGFDTTVWRLERDGRRYALRLFRPDKRVVLERELLALRAARAAGLPVPRIYAVGSYQQQPALLQEWSPGHTLFEAMQARPARTLALGHAFGRLHARLQQVPAPHGLRSGWIDWAGPLDSSLRSRLVRLSEPRPLRLLHLDWHPLNVLVDADGRPTAVLDWVNAHGGDPRADAARTVTVLRLSPPLGGARARLMRGLLELGWRAGYGPLGPHMAPFYAWAGAAMQHDLAARFSPAELAHVGRWTATWLRRSHLQS
jgi:aminoglycoside phosphotransferase (APT) family kinase protein